MLDTPIQPGPAPAIDPLQQQLQQMTVKHQVMERLVTYILFERQEETEVRATACALVEERHHHFHDRDPDVVTDWLQCGNDKCQAIATILERSKRPQVFINPISNQLMKDKYTFKLEWGQAGIRATLIELEEAQKLRDQQQAQATLAEGPENPRAQSEPASPGIVLTDV